MSKHIKLPPVSIHRGKLYHEEAEICIIILSTNSDERCVSVIESILVQKYPSSIIIVNTGIGSLSDKIGRYKEYVTLIECSERQMPGGTRNIGIHYSSSPIIAFLAADCCMSDKWIENQLASHEKYLSVASAIMPAKDKDGRIRAISWSSCIFTHFHRLPETPPENAVHFGLSYKRSVFDRLGYFDPNVRVGEDSIFNEKLSKIELPQWNPKIVTTHKYPTRLIEALVDQYGRARRILYYKNNQNLYTRISISTGSIKMTYTNAFHMLKYKEYRYNKSVLMGLMLLPIINMAFISGALFSRKKV